MELYINLKIIAREDPLSLGEKKDDSPYLRHARYQTILTEKITLLFKASGYRRVSTTSSLTYAIFLFRNEGGNFLKLKNNLEPNDRKKPVTAASVSVEGKLEMIAKVEALLKSLNMPKNAASILN